MKNLRNLWNRLKVDPKELIKRLSAIFLVYLLIEVLLRGLSFWVIFLEFWRRPLEATFAMAFREIPISILAVFLLSQKGLYTADSVKWVSDKLSSIYASKIGLSLRWIQKLGGPFWATFFAATILGPFAAALIARVLKLSVKASYLAVPLGSFSNALWATSLWSWGIYFLSHIAPWEIILGLVVICTILISILGYRNRRRRN